MDKQEDLGEMICKWFNSKKEYVKPMIYKIEQKYNLYQLKETKKMYTKPTIIKNEPLINIKF